MEKIDSTHQMPDFLAKLQQDFVGPVDVIIGDAGEVNLVPYTPANSYHEGKRSRLDTQAVERFFRTIAIVGGVAVIAGIITFVSQSESIRCHDAADQYDHRRGNYFLEAPVNECVREGYIQWAETVPIAPVRVPLSAQLPIFASNDAITALDLQNQANQDKINAFGMQIQQIENLANQDLTEKPEPKDCTQPECVIGNKP